MRRVAQSGFSLIFYYVTTIAPTATNAQTPPYPEPLCVANTITSDAVDPASFRVLDPCVCASDTATIEFDWTITAKADRYDIRAGIASGGNVIYQTCLSDVIANPGALNQIDGDACLDIDRGTETLSNVVMNLSCDPDGDGNVNPIIGSDLLIGWSVSNDGTPIDQPFLGAQCDNFAQTFNAGASVILSKISTDPTGATTGTDTFDFSSTGLCSSPTSITTLSDGVAESAPSSLGIDTFDATTQSYGDLTISEALVGAWEATSITCNTGGTVDLSASSITIPGSSISVGDTVTCTFTNQLNSGPTPSPAMTIAKVADDDSDVTLGQVITYTYTIVNTGNVDLTDATVSSTHNGSGVFSAIGSDNLINISGNSSDTAIDGSIDVLAPGDSATFAATYTVVQTDIDNATDIVKTATATAIPAAGTLTNPTASQSIDLEDPSPQLSITTIASDTADVVAGQTITYSYTISNNGNQTISAISLASAHEGFGTVPALDSDSATLTDNSPTGDSPNTTTGDGIWDTLAPGDSLQITDSYTITQQDIDQLQ